MYGDSNQVGYVDMYTTPGLRPTKNLLTYVPDKNLKHGNKSYRFGGELAKEMTHLIDNFTGNPDIETDF